MRAPGMFLAFALAAEAAAQPVPPEPVTIFLSLGANSKVVEQWNGSVTVAGGQLWSIEGHQFMDDDRVTAGGAWQCSTRRDEITGFPRVNYNEMSPAELPPPVFYPCTLFVTIRPAGSARVAVKTAKGSFEFGLSEIGLEPREFLNGRVTAQWTPAVERLTTEEYEDDEAAITRLPDGSMAVAWVAYKDRGDRILLRTFRSGSWEPAEEVTPAPADLFRCSLATDSEGSLWAFWSARQGATWHIRGRQKKGGRWEAPITLSEEGINTFHRAASSDDGTIFVVWQSFRGPAGKAHSDIYMKAYSTGRWSAETRVSDSPANDWEPSVAGGPGDSAFIAWDSYDRRNYDIFFRPWQDGRLGPVQRVTSSPRFQAHASVAVDAQGRPWLAWDESGANWGKDVGYLVTPAYGTPIHQERTIRLAMWDGKQWNEPREKLAPFYPYQLFPNFENPHILFDGEGTLNMVFRHWTRSQSHSIGAPLGWENYLTRFNGSRWTRPVPLGHSRGSIEKRPALARDGEGAIWAAWMTDNREFPRNVPQNAEIYAARLGSSGRAPVYGAARFSGLDEPFVEEVPVHPREEENVRAVRDYTIDAGGQKYRIYRGDMHRHTDVSQDFKYDGSLIEVYRYALDAASLDYIVPTDHQIGFDMEFTWWQDEKLKDLFHVPGMFLTLFGYERSVSYPNGHRNVIFPKRGTRTLPIPREEIRGEKGAAELFTYLHKNNGISMPHSSGTAQGTDWRDNDPEVEPLIEIYQGYRASYEYQNAPLAASETRLREQRSGFAPLGYWWVALAKGLKLGVQASSDHWSTHMSYACIVSEAFDRESLFTALKNRHAYGATDNIVLDFQAELDGKHYIMGDVINAENAPKLRARAIGTNDITQVVIVKNQTFVYTARPNSKQVDFEFVDTNFEPGSNYYYLRVVQDDRKVAWSSPIWVER